MAVRVGSLVPFRLQGDTREDLRTLLRSMAEAGLDHAVIGDHVSFHGGFGVDGLVAAAVMAAIEPRLAVATSVYQLPLRHPVAVARQLSTIGNITPGRLEFGVGVGGDDRHEMELCGVDPRTRGRRMDECLEIVSRLLAGESVTLKGEFFRLDAATVTPTPHVPIPVIVGGRTASAFRRAGRWGDGYVGLWISPSRFAEAVGKVAEEAADQGRSDVDWRHAMTVWCGFGPTEGVARQGLARAMEGLYRTPFEKFEKYSPYGSPERVAEFLAAYRDAGCTCFHLLTRGPSHAAGVEGAAEVRRLLGAGTVSLAGPPPARTRS